MSKRKKQEQLDENRSQFVCRFCQRIYYSVALDAFETDSATHIKKAKSHYTKQHHCTIKDRIFGKNKRG